MSDERDEFHDPTREVDHRQLIALASRANMPTEELRLEDLIELVRPRPAPPPPPVAPVIAPVPGLVERAAVYPIYRSRSRLPFALGCAAAAAIAIVVGFLVLIVGTRPM
jgi:hypothetical protein